MRILGIGARVDLGSLYRTLMREGHEVRVHASDPAFASLFDGLVERVADWRAALSWVGRDGLVLFEKVGQGRVQDELRAEGYRVIGGSTLGDRLEYDRGFGQDALSQAGLHIAPAHRFEDAARAAAWLQQNPGRMVLKHFNNARATFVGDHAQGLDVLFQLGRAPAGPVLLMPVIPGIEVGVGAYFDGTRFLSPACIDFEHKRFFPGEIGEMTGEMGTLVSYRGAEPLMQATLQRLEPLFAGKGHVGYVNLNMIVNEQGLWPLEFTCRFGNPGYAILSPLQTAGWGDLFGRMLEGGHGSFPTTPDWCTGLVLTIPPFPEERPGADPALDPPVLFHAPPDDPAHYHFSDMRQTDGQLYAGRNTGYAMVVTGAGPSIEASQAAALTRARSVCIPDLRYRTDIGERVRLGELDRLRQMGWFDA
ncbi:MAG: phosphoribosylamine--glycine ligase [Janthinobacterium lividum]